MAHSSTLGAKVRLGPRMGHTQSGLDTVRSWG